VETPVTRASQDRRTAPTRTCVGCASRDDADAMVRLVVAGDEVAFDLAGGSFGRGAHVHACPACLEKAPRGLARAFKRDLRVDAASLGRLLLEACDRRMAGLLLAARRTGALALGADAALDALARGAPLGIVASDAGSLASAHEVQRAVREGRAFSWSTKSGLGGLFGDRDVSVCAIRHDGIARELLTLRTAADAGATTARDGAPCSKFPEAR
jgi:predicted RNA-binding protein YlxR (DUF448 family)